MEQIDHLTKLGPEAAFDRRPAGVEVSLGVLWEPPERAERGTLDEYWEAQRLLNSLAEEIPRRMRVRRYAAELSVMKGYIDVTWRSMRGGQRTHAGASRKQRPRVPVEWGRELAGTIPQARLEVFDGASHSLVIRDPKARQRVIDFIREVGDTPPR